MRKRCVVMFSGGRDSTLATLELAKLGYELVLVTVTSSHLVGVERVRRRLKELERHIPKSTKWICVQQPVSPVMIPIGFSDRTCLPCQQAYVLAGYKFLQEEGARDLALGYAGYQSSWPEQTPSATSRLRRLLQERDITLHLPAYEINTKEQALKRLSEAGMATESLEQKCIKQVHNISFEGEKLEQQLDLWEALLRRSIDEVGSVRLVRVHSQTLDEV